MKPTCERLTSPARECGAPAKPYAVSLHSQPVLYGPAQTVNLCDGCREALIGKGFSVEAK